MGPIARRGTAHTISGHFSLATPTRCLTFLLCVASIAGLVALPAGGGSVGQLHPRLKRNALQLCLMITQHTGEWCMNYNNYGCYCGIGQTSTATPVDEVDNCCRLHDACYHSLGKWCYWWLPVQLVTYSWDCDNGNCTCTDSPEVSPCYYNTCLCDVTFGRCLQNTTYNNEFYYMNRTECHDS